MKINKREFFATLDDGTQKGLGPAIGEKTQQNLTTRDLLKNIVGVFSNSVERFILNNSLSNTRFTEHHKRQKLCIKFKEMKTLSGRLMQKTFMRWPILLGLGRQSFLQRK